MLQQSVQHQLRQEGKRVNEKQSIALLMSMYDNSNETCVQHRRNHG